MNWQESVTEKGFAIIPAVVPEKQLSTLMCNLAEIPLQRSRAGVRHALQHTSIAALAQSSQLLEIGRTILGNGAFPFRATLFEKSRSANWLVAWHQDTALPLRERRERTGWGPWSVKEGVSYAHAPASALCRVMALRIHLDDSTATNGPLRVLPGTHTLGVLEDATIQKIAERIPPVQCEVPRGGILVMRPLLVHASSKSQSPRARRVLHLARRPHHVLFPHRDLHRGERRAHAGVLAGVGAQTLKVEG